MGKKRQNARKQQRQAQEARKAALLQGRGKHQAPPEPLEDTDAPLADEFVDLEADEGLEPETTSGSIEGEAENTSPQTASFSPTEKTSEPATRDGQSDGECRHLSMVSPNAVKRVLRQHRLLAFPCKICEASMPNNQRMGGGKKSKKQKRKNRAAMRSTRVQPELIWICLACGHTGCGRDAKAHAVSHGDRPGHSLAYNVSKSELWCYACDRFLEVAQVTSTPGMEESALVKALAAIAVQQEENGTHAEWLPQSYYQRNVSAANGGKLASSKSRQKEKALPVSTALSKKLITFIHQHGSGSGNRGLVNQGNTCFFNSVLQNLVQLGPLRQVMLPAEQAAIPDEEGCLTAALREFIAEMWSSTSRTAVKPLHLLQTVGRYEPRFRGRRQQDAHELLRTLLQNIRQEELDRQKKNETEPCDQTFVDEVFGGLLESVITCHTCMEESITTESFLDITAPIVGHGRQTMNKNRRKQSGGSVEANSNVPVDVESDELLNARYRFDKQGNVERRMRCFRKPAPGTLEGCLFAYTAPERLEGDNAYICMNCTKRAAEGELSDDEDGFDDGLVRTVATKQLLVREAPPVLTIGLKRFAMTNSGGSYKISEFVRFPEVLDLTPFSIPGIGLHVYYLSGIVVHGGTLKGGHYVAQTRTLPTIPASQCGDSRTDREPEEPQAHFFRESQQATASDEKVGFILGTSEPADCQQPSSEGCFQPTAEASSSEECVISGLLESLDSVDIGEECDLGADESSLSLPGGSHAKSNNVTEDNGCLSQATSDPVDDLEWYFYSDTSVRESSLHSVLSDEAYLLFYTMREG